MTSPRTPAVAAEARVNAYLDELARMLADLPPDERDDVLAGLIEHSACHLRPPLAVVVLVLRPSSQGGQDSNLQPAVLETAALPIEPPP